MSSSTAIKRKFSQSSQPEEMVKAVRGVLVECEPAIKSILVHIDSTHHHEFIIDDLDETHLFVKETMLQVLKQKLEERLKETYRPEEPLEDSD